MGDEDAAREDGRVEWARERTLLAKERTYAAWLRTGLGAMGVGIAVPRLLADHYPHRLLAALGTLLLLCSAGIVALSYRTARKTIESLHKERLVGAPEWIFALVTAALVVVDLVLVAMLWFD